MSKLNLPDIGSLANSASARQAINDNFTAIEEAIDNTLSRDGTAPNQMEADIDLNSHRLLNVADPIEDLDGVNKRSVGDLVEEFVSQIAETIIEGTARVDRFIATAAQTEFALTESPGFEENLYVFDNGIAMTPGIDFNLTGATMQTLSFLSGRSEGAEIVARYVQLAPTDSLLRADLANSIDDRGGDLVAYRHHATSDVRTVKEKLRDYTISVKDFGATGDGVTNDTTSIMAGIEHVAEYGGVLYFPAGTYCVTPPLQLLSATKAFALVGESRRSTIIKRTSTDNGSLFNISGVNNFEIKSMQLDYNKDEYPSSNPASAGHGIAISNGNNVKISDLHILDWVNSGVLVFHFPGLPPPASAQEENNVIEDCFLDGGGNANNGILFVDQFYSYIRNCTVTDLGQAGTPQSALQFKNRCYRSHIVNCIADDARHGVAFGEEDVVGIAAEQCSVANVIVRNCVWGMYLGKTADSSFENINIDQQSLGSHGIEMTDCVDNTFMNIKMKDVQDAGAYAVKFGGTSSGNVVHFSKISSPAAIPEIGLWEATSANNSVFVQNLKSGSPITYAGQCFLDQNTSATSGNSWEIRGWANQAAFTIASDAITLKNPLLTTARIDTEAAAAADDLATITGPQRDGQTIILKTSNNSRDVTVKHGTGNISLAGGVDFTLDTVNDKIVLQWTGGIDKWCEISRSNNT